MTISLTPPVPASDKTLRRRHVRDQRRVTPEHLERLHWSAERLRVERQHRLRKLVDVACRRSSWHRARLGGIDCEQLQEADLAQLPVMTKDDVMANFDAILTDPGLSLERVEEHLAALSTTPEYLLGHYQPVVSGGSSGRRGVFVYDWAAWTECFAAGYRYLYRDLRTRPLTMAVIAAGSPAHISRAILATFSDPESLLVHPLPITLPIGDIIDGLNQLNPDTLLVFPSGLVELVRAACDGRLHISPRAIVTGGEPLTPELRAAAEEVFGTRVLNWWLSSEAGPMAIGCGHGPWMHLSDDLMIIEAVDEHNQPVPPGVASAKVLLTVLYNTTLPLIRYELSDEVTVLDHGCPCGSEHRLIADVQGRHDDVFFYGTVAVHPHVFRTVLGSERAIVEYRVIQTLRGADVEVRGHGDFAAVQPRLVDALAALGVPEPEVQLSTVDGFVRQQTGKVKRFIALP
jgi:phenylacetate-coenzyme A ligase PaaK-like adenylate-forming protein